MSLIKLLRIRRIAALMCCFAWLSVGVSALAAEEAGDDEVETEEAAETEATEESEAVERAPAGAEEEVIVTGSYIRRDNFDLPSPIVVLDEIDLEMAGTPDLGDIMFDQTFQTGVNANATPFEGGGADDQQWNQGVEVWANLRGLGSRATMTMMDGHRLPADTNTWGRRAGVDVTNTYPGIAIGRVETILDGASALYGSEAVGGVINLIPRRNFEGLLLTADWNEALERGAPSRGISLLAGADGEKTDLIFAMELRETEQMRYTDRPDYILSAKDPWRNEVFTPWWHDAGGRSSPGDWVVPVRDANGELMPWAPAWSRGAANEPNADNLHIGNAPDGRLMAVRRADPGCAYGFGAGNNHWGTPTTGGGLSGPANSPPETTYNDLAKHGNFLNGMLHAHSGSWRGEDCIMSVSDMQDLQAEMEQNKAMGFFEYEFNDYVKFRGEVVVASLDYYTRDVTGGLDEMDNTSLFGPMVPYAIGDNPGNPFRAFADGSSILGYDGPNTPNRLDWTDLNGNGRYDYGTEPGEGMVFAQDICTADACDGTGDGIPDRDFNGDGVADVGAQRNPAARVVLISMDDANGNGIPDRFDLDGGGIRLFEDVRQWYGELNVHPKNPRNNNLEWAGQDGDILTYRRRAQRDNLRIRLGGEFNVPDTEWIVDADWVWALGKRTRQYPEPLWPETAAAMRCQAGPRGDQCWNPFTTTYLNTDEDGQLLGDPSNNFPDPNNIGWRPPDAEEVNTEIENRNAGIILAYNKQDLGMQILDLVASNSNLFHLWYNDAPVGMAVGMHWRLETEEWRPNVQNQAAIGGGKIGLRESEQSSQAVFMEFQLPLIDHPVWGDMELQIAGRYAEIETRGIIGQIGSSTFDTVIPKLALRYSPTDWFAFRTSLTEGYVTPGLYALFGEPQTTGESIGGVRDYLCDEIPELVHCSGDVNGTTQGVVLGSSPNSELGAEVSELWNAGFSLRFFDGSLVMDVDYTTVDFNGRADRLGHSGHVSLNEIGFEDFVLGRCPGTLLNYDSPPDLSNLQPGEEQPPFIPVSTEEYRASTSQEELDCRADAAADWVMSEARNGEGERPVGNALLERGGGDNGLGLTLVENPWLAQGQKTTATVIYNVRYTFDADKIPFVPVQSGSMTASLSATQYVEQSIIRWAEESGNPRAGIKVDGVGNRNTTSFVGPGEGLYSALPPTPEWRVNVGLRWYRDNHTAQLSGRWHDSVTNYNIAWDEQREAGLLSESQAEMLETERCSWQPSPVCGFDSRHYWDVSYTYSKPEFLGFGYVSMNVAVRNVFDTYPDPVTTPAGHEGYLDNIMGRLGFVRLTLGF